MPGVSIDVSKMKMADLKKELTARGLSTDGKKNELQERLEEALAGETEEVDEATEQALLEGKATPAKKAPDAAAQEKTPQEKRAERFGVPLTGSAQKAARAARFGIVDPEVAKAARAARFGISKASPKGSVGKGQKITADIETLKSRAERFGEVSSKDLKKAAMLEKKKEIIAMNKARAAAEAAAAAARVKSAKVPIIIGEDAAAKMKRAERFAK